MSEAETQITVSDFVNQLIAEIASLSPDAPVDRMLEVRNRCEALKQRATEVMRLMDDGFADWLQANGEIVSGDIRYYYGVEKTTKCNSNSATADAVFEAVGGDLGAFVETLSSNAFKPGACRNVLSPETFDACFETTEKKDVKTGKPKKSVQKINTKFLR